MDGGWHRRERDWFLVIASMWRFSLWRGGETATRRSAKPLCEGSTPSRASTFIDSPGFIQALVLSQAFDPTMSPEAHWEAWTTVRDLPSKAPNGLKSS